MFRLLKADEIELRISQISQKGLSLLLYKTARTDANLLDETVGPMNWQNDFKLIDGVLFGGIGIKADSEYVWKWDCGVESTLKRKRAELPTHSKEPALNVELAGNFHCTLYIHTGFKMQYHREERKACLLR